MTNDLEHDLRQACIDSGMSIKRLADESGICYASLHGFFHGREITTRTASKLARTLGLALEPNRKATKKGG